MHMRMNYYQAGPKAMSTLMGIERYLNRESGLEKSLLELVKTSVSQINSCAFCMDIHTKDSRKAGETEQRLYGLSSWKEATCYTPRERAALLWAESLTHHIGDGIKDFIYEEVREHFFESEMVDLSLVICTISSWNPFAINLRTEVGSYTPGQFDEK